jgi:hypothetical protein
MQNRKDRSMSKKTDRERKRLLLEYEKSLHDEQKRGFLRRDIRKQGIEVQTWGVSAAGETVYAGVHFVPEVSGRWMWHLHNHWRRWRKWYDNLPWNRREDYPAKHAPRVVVTLMHPVYEPEKMQHISVVGIETT